MANKAGFFITLEGGEGAGKSTQARLLADALEKAGHTVRVTREPGGSPTAERIRDVLVTGDPGQLFPMSELFLLAAARYDHVNRTIRPALEAGEIVICDRFSDSTTAYQGHGHGLDLDRVQTVNQMATDGLMPDLTLMLWVPVETGLARAAKRAGAEDRFERMDRGFHDRLQAGFDAIAAAEPARCKTVDATGDVETVAGQIWQIVSTRFPDRADGLAH